MVTRSFDFHFPLVQTSTSVTCFSLYSVFVMTANANKTICQYTCTLSSDGEDARTKDKFTSVSNMHEIDEDSETDEETAASVQSGSPVTNEEKDTVQSTKNASEDEYTGESFYSDESCDESEVTKVTSESLVNDSSPLPCTAHLRRNENIKSTDAEVLATSNSLELRLQNDEFVLVSDEPPSAIITDRFVKPRKCKRWNMSFTDEEMRRIERENELLLRKIMAQQKSRHKVLEEHIVQSRTSSSAINRRKLQKRIDDDNMLLVRRIQQAKSCVLTNASKMSSRLNFL
ncbi:cilia- and flagella-associated protein 97-like [Odontomachus brunneus]|uniref:cilia- and flagella-associated protein 97-like n=1 Tax=Odontomachus brunneus TaxID=486640 RepID=UPI0013F1E808|nr:cilia- and flagella-associated protein 97-like [Odontomachus brunneus]